MERETLSCFEKNADHISMLIALLPKSLMYENFYIFMNIKSIFSVKKNVTKNNYMSITFHLNSK